MWPAVDAAMGKMRTKMQIYICILPAHAPSVTGILTELFANQLRPFNDEFMHVCLNPYIH